MNKLQDYLDYKYIRVIGKSGEIIEGMPLSVLYADESPYNEDSIDIERQDGTISGFRESEIDRIEIIE